MQQDFSSRYQAQHTRQRQQREILMRLRNIHKTYASRGGHTQALRGIDLDIHKGEFVAIMGPSGSGKSTLMHILGLLDTPTEGSYLLGGREVSRLSERALAQIRNREIGFVFQQFNLLSRATVLDNVELPTIYGQRHKRSGAKALIERVGLASRITHRSNELSGGQVQRVAIARALIMQPLVVIADEPTGNLDSATSEEIMQLFREINREEGTTIVLVTHEEDVARHAERIIRLKDGRILLDSENTFRA